MRIVLVILFDPMYYMVNKLEENNNLLYKLILYILILVIILVLIWLFYKTNIFIIEILKEFFVYVDNNFFGSGGSSNSDSSNNGPSNGGPSNNKKYKPRQYTNLTEMTEEDKKQHFIKYERKYIRGKTDEQKRLRVEYNKLNRKIKISKNEEEQKQFKIEKDKICKANRELTKKMKEERRQFIESEEVQKERTEMNKLQRDYRRANPNEKGPLGGLSYNEQLAIEAGKREEQRFFKSIFNYDGK